MGKPFYRSPWNCYELGEVDREKEREKELGIAEELQPVIEIYEVSARSPEEMKRRDPLRSSRGEEGERRRGFVK